MNRTAEVALTPDGKTNVNRLRVPEFTLVKLFLKIGGKASKCHFPPEAPPPKEGDTGKDDFHFVPEKETIEIAYELDDACGLIETAKLELFCRFREAALWTLDLAKLGDDWLAHGKHTVKWDGRVVTPTAAEAGTKGGGGMEHDLTKLAPDKDAVKDSFIDGYVTLEHTPYKFRITLGSTKGQGQVITAWTYFQILIKSIEFDIGPEEAVPAAAVDDDRHKRDKAVRKRIEDDGKIPADGATRKVLLVSNLFKTNSNQMGTDTGFTNFDTLWEKGPQIPVIAKIRLADSSDAEVKLDESDKGAVALGKVRFLWDWEDPDEDADSANSEAKPKAYIKSAIDYYKNGTDTTRSAKDHTYPKGDNSHVDRGGKRGPDADPIFPVNAGYDKPKDTLDAGKFPFKVEACTERKWAAFSYGWTSGKLKGKTGVVFQPSRMAGDDYKLTVYLAYDKTADDKWAIDKKDEPLVAATAIKKLTGKFQMWREIHVVRYIRKLPSIGTFLPGQIGAVQALYRPAYVEVENKMQGGDSYSLEDHRLSSGTEPDYNAICQGIFTTSTNVLFSGFLAVASGADHKSVAAAFKVQTYAGYVATYHKSLHGDQSDFGAGITPGNLGTANVAGLAASPKKTRLGQTKAGLITAGMETEAKYKRKLDELMFPMAKKQLTNGLQVVSGSKDGSGDAAREGITVLHFDNVHSAGAGGKLGSAIDPTDATGEKCVFLLTTQAVDTFVHEIGHHLFLAHAPTAAGYVEATHDAADTNCMMSYTRPRKAFCGQCQLRLRGWKGSTLNKAGASNKKP